ncbi:MAG: Rod shape-determining protein MreD [Chitinophagaceae bacterium]|jgi:rod shape-determining protein MreD|nr:Rod shape-determining protein MreD [Chitinophagaceae bacterium]
MTGLVKNIVRFFLFLLLQAFVLNKIPPLHQFIVPYLYFLFILWLPFNISRTALMVIAVLFGLCMDLFTNTPGLHAAPCLLIAYLRPFLLNLLLPQETTELSYVEPSLKSMGWAPYFVYVLILTFMHHAYLVLLEWLQFGNFLYFLGKVTGTTAISIMLIFLTEMLFYRKARFRTNIA